jgi:L-2-hydroxyglutarate oxidase LhgO
VAILAVVLIAAGFAAWTYPRDVVTIPVSLTIGADVVQKTFTVPVADNAVQLEVTVSSGGALWSAEIDTGNATVFLYRTAQGGQTTYTSEWIIVGAGDYSIRFARVGSGKVGYRLTVNSRRWASSL